MDTKRCPRCGETKPLTEFSPRKEPGNGTHYSWCRACSRTTRAAERASWSEGQREAHQILKHRYKLTEAEYEELLIEQNGVCAICRRPETALDRRGKVRRLSVDHNHETGEVRGLLCCNCNRGLGSLEENPDFFLAAIAYLTRSTSGRNA